MSIHVKPVLTEKALQLAAVGKYTFMVPMSFTKIQVKNEISRIFGVDVKGVSTSTKKSTTKVTLRRQHVTSGAMKKAVVKVKEGQKIDAFAETK